MRTVLGLLVLSLAGCGLEVADDPIYAYVGIPLAIEAPIPETPPEGGVEGCPGAGALTTIAYNLNAGRETYWTEGEGIDPGTPGWHEEWNNTYTVRLPARRFGEMCRAENADHLVETNPDPAGGQHPHANDVGHPCVYSCSAWCRGELNADGGSCEGGIGLTTPSGDVTSAKCTCENPDVCCQVMAGFSYEKSEACDAIDGSINHGTDYALCIENIPVVIRTGDHLPHAE